MTPRQRELLRALCDVDGDDFVRPMDVGGTDGSHHSKTLRQLVAKGYAERRERGGWTRNAWGYRATDKGRAALHGARCGHPLTTRYDRVERPCDREPGHAGPHRAARRA